MKYKVYLLNEDGTDNYKIGITSKSVNERILELQTGNSNKITEIYTYETSFGFILERTLHKAFQSKKINEGGNEWFILMPEDLQKYKDTITMTEYNLEILHNENNPFIKKTI